MSVFARLKKAREEKKGFTLVELIVVLVILAILAAILVPALLGWIDKAKEKQLVVTGRTVMLAGQSAGSEAYSTNSDITDEAVQKYLGDDIPYEGTTSGGPAWSVTFAKYKVTEVEYTDGTDRVVYKEDDNGDMTWTFQKAQGTLTKSASDTATAGSGTVTGPVEVTETP